MGIIKFFFDFWFVYAQHRSSIKKMGRSDTTILGTLVVPVKVKHYLKDICGSIMPQTQINLFFDISVKSVHKVEVLLLRDGNGGLDDPVMSDVVALGLLPFLSFFSLPS